MSRTLSNPSSVELLSAVSTFLINDIAPQVNGQSAFHIKVACNILNIVAREIENGADLNESVCEALSNILSDQKTGSDEAQDLQSLKAELSEVIKNDQIKNNAELLDALKMLTLKQLAIDNPKYSGYHQALKSNER